ncbi:RHS repeat-associated core domain-containing protein [Niveispirillum lacus]|uniref:RHS repeat-associated core domain-containing protein n=1 Tax=Niveispirillum lacus TaxID=1981099 RepID=UPI0013FDDE77|nr:RHS repeat-associated core domain-containing protein [Niveispirillum lacus]
MAIHSPTAGLIRLLPNRQGSVIGWLRPDGKLGGAYTYDAYGNSPQAGAAGPAFRYAGMRFDVETGLYHTPNRAYDPVDGRWMQLDPIGIKDGLNRYAYVKNSPVMGVDPTGLEAYIVARPLGFTDYARHMFVVVAPEVGAEPIARFSFGPGKGSGMLVDLTGTRNETDIADATAWRALNDPLDAAKNGITICRINASDEATIEAGLSVSKALGSPDRPGNIPYSYLPELTPGAANSNSEAVKVASDSIGNDKSTKSLPGKPPLVLPPGAPTPGAEQAYRVPSKEKIMCTGSKIARESC